MAQREQFLMNEKKKKPAMNIYDVEIWREKI